MEHVSTWSEGVVPATSFRTRLCNVLVGPGSKRERQKGSVAETRAMLTSVVAVVQGRKEDHNINRGEAETPRRVDELSSRAAIRLVHSSSQSRKTVSPPQHGKSRRTGEPEAATAELPHEGRNERVLARSPNGHTCSIATAVRKQPSTQAPSSAPIQRTSAITCPSKPAPLSSSRTPSSAAPTPASPSAPALPHRPTQSSTTSRTPISPSAPAAPSPRSVRTSSPRASRFVAATEAREDEC